MSVKADQLKIVLYPHPVLRKKAKPLSEITPEVRDVAARMIFLMHEAPGVGLAAPQVGLPWRLFVANPTGKPEDDRVFINPVLRDPGEEPEAYEEGCLSLPDIQASVTRPKLITVEAIGLDGKKFTLTSDELPARIWQHEIDHLDGVLILDRMTPIDKLSNRRAIKELEAEAAAATKKR
jgi:peptide deformylase